MKIDVSPSNIVTVNIRKYRKLKYCTVAVPVDIVKKYDLKKNDRIVICYLCKESEKDITLADGEKQIPQITSPL